MDTESDSSWKGGVLIGQATRITAETGHSCHIQNPPARSAATFSVLQPYTIPKTPITTGTSTGSRNACHTRQGRSALPPTPLLLPCAQGQQTRRLGQRQALNARPLNRCGPLRVSLGLHFALQPPRWVHYPCSQRHQKGPTTEVAMATATATATARASLARR